MPGKGPIGEPLRRAQGRVRPHRPRHRLQCARRSKHVGPDRLSRPPHRPDQLHRAPRSPDRPDLLVPGPREVLTLVLPVIPAKAGIHERRG